MFIVDEALMNKKNKSIDGIILKRSDNQLGGQVINDTKKQKPSPKKDNVDEGILPNDFIDSFADRGDFGLSDQQEGANLMRSDINDSLQTIDTNVKPEKKLSRRKRRKLAKQAKNDAKKHRSKIWKIIKLVVILIIVCVVGFGGYTGYKLIATSNKVFNGNIFQVFQNVPLQQDANGRSNFLVVGTSEDDPGHEGATLTDSILVVSIDQTNHNAYVFSVPRDFYVEYGEACVSGYAGKVNAYFACSNEGDTNADEQDRLAKTQKLIGDVFGLDIQYGAHVNYTVLKQSVDAVGGIDVDVQGSNGADGVLDRNFDYLCNYTCYLVKYENGMHHLDGQHALYLAQARGHDAPTYGLSRSNFDREVNQQKIVMALKEKAVSTGSLTDFNKVTKLIDALGSNLRTNVQTKEIRTLIDIASKTKSADIHSISLVGDGGDSSLLTTGNGNVIPIAGETAYGDIQAYIARKLSSNPIIRESAPIVVLNGSGQVGLGQTKADELTAADYNVTLVDNAPDGTYAPVEIYQIGTDSSGTAAALAKLYGVTLKTTTPPTTVNGDVRFVIIFGPVAAT